MRIAVTNENNKVFQHFDQCKSFSVFEIENNEIKSKTILKAGESEHSTLATLLSGNNIDIVICNNIKSTEKEALDRCGIELVTGASGNVEQVIESYMDNTLLNTKVFTYNKKCC
ncbi:NifB/NifX family molybdenum-iron cluster-binding protein [Anaerovorax odorimutans]|uniref:NifB/NifX family molybdenum-iron cluster-binding protein n=1 Tax=Anaerovorax odorimutans TaxID=109327 RepID=UPI0004045A3D|nr:NifB/NifX family molybdenum-iron cluster-binding protein [Anaerovorax odorimutans]